MSKRIVLGNIGSGNYGLRVSKPSTDAINADGTAATVDNLLFDSLNPIGHLPLWRYYRRQVSAGTRNSTTLIVTPGTTAVSFGTTLPFAPFAFCYKEVSGGVLSQYGHFSSEDAGYSGIGRVPDDGFLYTTTTTNFTISNYETTAAYFRLFIFYFGV
jgi:hypothetical protein